MARLEWVHRCAFCSLRYHVGHRRGAADFRICFLAAPPETAATSPVMVLPDDRMTLIILISIIADNGPTKLVPPLHLRRVGDSRNSPASYIWKLGNYAPLQRSIPASSVLKLNAHRREWRRPRTSSALQALTTRIRTSAHVAVDARVRTRAGHGIRDHLLCGVEA